MEWRLKQEILSSYFDAGTAQQNAELIRDVEVAAIEGADAIVCVSESDAEWVMSQTVKPVVVAPNGILMRIHEALHEYEIPVIVFSGVMVVVMVAPRGVAVVGLTLGVKR